MIIDITPFSMRKRKPTSTVSYVKYANYIRAKRQLVRKVNRKYFKNSHYSVKREVLAKRKFAEIKPKKKQPLIKRIVRKFDTWFMK